MNQISPHTPAKGTCIIYVDEWSLEGFSYFSKIIFTSQKIKKSLMENETNETLYTQKKLYFLIYKYYFLIYKNMD